MRLLRRFGLQAKPWPEGGSSVFHCLSIEFNNEKYEAA
jgi:hypothetical protein